MAKIIKYYLYTHANHGTQEAPDIVEMLSLVEMGWNEANEEIARKEAYNGKYTIEDDGQPEPETQPTDAQRIAELEEALALLLSGGDGMKPELKAKILAYNKSVKEKGEKASDMDIVVAAFAKLPPGQLKKVLTEDVIAVLKKYGVEIE